MAVGRFVGIPAAAAAPAAVDPNRGFRDMVRSQFMAALQGDPTAGIKEHFANLRRQREDQAVADAAASVTSRGFDPSDGVGLRAKQDFQNSLVLPVDIAEGDALMNAQQGRNSLLATLMQSALMDEPTAAAPLAPAGGSGGGVRVMDSGGGWAGPQTSYSRGGGGGGGGVPTDLNDWGPGFGKLGSERGIWRDKNGDIGGGLDGMYDQQQDATPGFSGPGAAQLPSGLVPGLNPAGPNRTAPLTPRGNSAAPWSASNAKANAMGSKLTSGLRGSMNKALNPMKWGMK